MGGPKYKFQMYKSLQKNKSTILDEARKAADEIGIPKDIRGRFGSSPAMSGCPGPLIKEVSEAVEAASKKVIPLTGLVDQLREMIKDVYGDEYDAAPICTCEAALGLAFDVLATPPMLGRGNNYRTRYIAPYERHLHHQAGYGRPFPPKYKDAYADRGAIAGELGIQGKRLNNLDVVIVPLVGAKYDVYGIKYHPCALLMEVKPEESAEKIAEVAERHANALSAFTSLGYDTPGYGYGVRDEEGVPRLQKLIGKLAEEYDVPYINDDASGLPLMGTDPRKINADVIVYSMDKSALSPTSGLIVGKEDVMVPIRRALGFHGNRWGTTSSYGKAAYVTFDPGKEAITGQLAALRIMRDEPERLTEPVDESYKIIKEEFAAIDPEIKDGLVISKSYNMRAVEVNYQKTWKNGELGVPIFGIEDMYAGTDLITEALVKMGILPEITYDANCLFIPGQGTTDEEGHLIEERMRYCAKGYVRAMEIVSKYAGITC